MFLAITYALAAAVSAQGNIENQAKKLLYGLECTNFGMKFTVTKRQLYRSEKLPHHNKFVLGGRNNCIRELYRTPLEDQDGNQWKEKRTTVELDFFRDNSLENCGMSLSQDKYGIRTEILVAGKRPRADAASVIPRVLVLSCYYPIDNGVTYAREEKPDDILEYESGTYVVGERSITVRKAGELHSPFELYDVRGNKTEEMFPEHDLSIRHVRVGETLMVGVRPKPVWVDGVNANPILKNSARWDYFLRDCTLSGTVNGETKTIQLINNNCKTRSYQVQLLSKVGIKDTGHIMMFEALAFPQADDHSLECKVDVCLKARDGSHMWPGCHRSCDNQRWFDQSADEKMFQIPTTTNILAPTTRPTTLAVNTALPVVTEQMTTQWTTQPAPEPTLELLQALEVCIDWYHNDHFYQYSSQDQVMWQICQYIMVRFPEEFTPDK